MKGKNECWVAGCPGGHCNRLRPLYSADDTKRRGLGERSSLISCLGTR